MIQIDTNILIRLMTNDVPHLRIQAEQAVMARKPNELSIPDAVLSELFFVLQHNPLYKDHYTRKSLCVSLNDLLLTPQLGISEAAESALALAEHHPKLDFTDCLLAAYANNQSENLVSFDKDLLKILH